MSGLITPGDGSTHPLGQLPQPGEPFVLLIARKDGRVDVRSNFADSSPQNMAAVLEEVAASIRRDSLGVHLLQRPPS